MNSKTSYTLCSSSSFNNSQKLPSSGPDLNLTQKLYLARQKLRPVIDNVMKIATENRRKKQSGTPYYLTVEQYEDAIWASQILREVDGICINTKNDKRKKSYNANHFNLEKKNVKVNKHGKIYIDTSILVQLIELHNTLGDIINHIQDTPTEGNTTNDASSYTQTECSNLSEKYDSLERRRILSNDKLNVFVNLFKKDSVEVPRKKNVPREVIGKKAQFATKTHNDDNDSKQKLNEVTSLTFPFGKELFILSAHTIRSSRSIHQQNSCSCSKKNLSTLPEERTSNSEVKLSTSVQLTRKTKSTGSLRSKVTDAAGAREIIVKCISDLNKVKSYFEMESVDVCVSAEVQMPNADRDDNIQRGDKECCCTKSGPVEDPVDLLDSKNEAGSKLIICIKGKDEDEGDVQIIIRRCSDCQIVDAPGDDEKDDVFEQGSQVIRSHHQIEISDPDGVVVVQDDEGHSIRSSHDIQRSGINVIFDPDNPSQSVVKPSKSRCPYYSGSSVDPCKSCCLCRDDPNEPKKKSSVKISDSVRISRTSLPRQDDAVSVRKNVSDSGSYSRIKLYETTNLCFCTEDGQELVISLTIKPKATKARDKLNLKELFSESATHVCACKKGASSTRGDRVIPLSRTKVCSSLEFDVTVMDTRIKHNGIKHINPNIVVRLQELGVNNLLRACRPVKCGRPAVLNETLRKCLPYSASLMSLPLEDIDADIIGHSLNMSLNKIKRSKFMVKDRVNKEVYFTHLENNMTCTKEEPLNYQALTSRKMRKVEGSPKNRVKDKKLNFYINLVHDVEDTYTDRIYEVRFFEIKKYNNDPLQNTINQLPGNNKVHKADDKKIKDEVDQLGTRVCNRNCKFASNVSIENNKRDLKRKVNLNQNKNIHGRKGTANKIQSQIVKDFTLNTRQLECNTDSGNSSISKQERKRADSKIPVYKGNTNKMIHFKEDLECESDIYDISLQSLPREDSGVIQGNETKVISHEKREEDEDRKENENVPWTLENNLIVKSRQGNTPCCTLNSENLVKEKNNVDESNSTPHFCHTEKSSGDSFELYSNILFPEKYFSGQTLCKKQSSTRLLKKRKKKSQFRLSKSRSEIFFSDCENKMTDTNTETDQEERTKSTRCDQSETFARNDFNEQLDNFKSVINFFMKIFYDYVIRDALLEARRNTFRNVEDTSCLSLMKKDIVTPRLFSQPNVEAGMDHEDVSVHIHISETKSRNYERNTATEKFIMDYFEKNFSHSTSYFATVKGSHSFQANLNCISKYCQTVDRNMRSKEDLTFERRSSCDNFDNFIVRFESSTSTNSSNPQGNISFSDLLNNYIEYCLTNECSIYDDYDRILNIMNTNSPFEMGMEPIKYFIYQNFVRSPCSCNGTAKEPVTVKYKNEKDLKNLQSVEDYSYLCKKCGCYIPAPVHGQTDLTNYCACPKQTKRTSKTTSMQTDIQAKEKKRSLQPSDFRCRICGCYILQPTKNGLVICSNCLKKLQLGNIKKDTGSGWKSRTAKGSSSLKWFPFKKCLSTKKDWPCFYSSKKNAGVMCAPDYAHASTAANLKHGSDRKKSPSNCYCDKCKEFSDDGSCYCSHCKKINEKSVDTKSSNKEIGTQCVCCGSKENNNMQKEKQVDKEIAEKSPSQKDPSKEVSKKPTASKTKEPSGSADSPKKEKKNSPELTTAASSTKEKDATSGKDSPEKSSHEVEVIKDHGHGHPPDGDDQTLKKGHKIDKEEPPVGEHAPVQGSQEVDKKEKPQTSKEVKDA